MAATLQSVVVQYSPWQPSWKMVAILKSTKQNLSKFISVHNFKITFYVHISVLPNHVIWLSAVIFKVKDSILG